MRGAHFVALDQGTTSSRAIVFDAGGKEIRISSRPLAAYFPQDAWVEQNPHDIWESQLAALREAVHGFDSAEISALSITNQRETVVCWDRKTGEPLAPAIVWQCRRSVEICSRLKKEGLEPLIRERTGLVLDSYFSATKIAWLLEQIPGLRERAARGEAVFGTVDSWLMYRLSEKKEFVTEASNASRTMLFNIEKGDWDDELLTLFSLRRDNLAVVKSSLGVFCETRTLGRPVPVLAVLGDQQASLYGHGCKDKDRVKCTFGTGAFLLLNTGATRQHSSAGLLSTVAWNIPGAAGPKVTYALEGSVFVAGAAVQWLRDKLGILQSAAESEVRAANVKDSGGVVFVPAFVGLGAPHWNSSIRGALLGVTRDTSADHIVRAALQGVAHQVADILETTDFANVKSMRIDGGMAVNKVFCQILSDIAKVTLETALRPEVTAFGVAALAASGEGLDWHSQTTNVRRFAPGMEESTRQAMRKRWKTALSSLETIV